VLLLQSLDVSTWFLQLLFFQLNLVGVIYMLLQNVLSSAAINVLFIGLVFASLFIMYATPVEYKRSAFDQEGLPPVEHAPESNSLAASQSPRMSIDGDRTMMAVSTAPAPTPDLQGHLSLRVRME
jgi:hypothetical protein